MDKGDEMSEQNENGPVSPSTTEGGVKRKRRTTKAKTVDGKRVTPVTEMPASNRVEAPGCRLCHNTNTFVYATRQRIRYCKCRRCGHTWTFASDAVTVSQIQTR
jgi:DNA-directed RNA polymerase subunit M/transcription elongation factor TFIIS